MSNESVIFSLWKSWCKYVIYRNIKADVTSFIARLQSRKSIHQYMFAKLPCHSKFIGILNVFVRTLLPITRVIFYSSSHYLFGLFLFIIFKLDINYLSQDCDVSWHLSDVHYKARVITYKAIVTYLMNQLISFFYNYDSSSRNTVHPFRLSVCAYSKYSYVFLGIASRMYNCIIYFCL